MQNKSEVVVDRGTFMQDYMHVSDLMACEPLDFPLRNYVMSLFHGGYPAEQCRAMNMYLLREVYAYGWFVSSPIDRINEYIYIYDVLFLPDLRVSAEPHCVKKGHGKHIVASRKFLWRPYRLRMSIRIIHVSVPSAW